MGKSQPAEDLTRSDPRVIRHRATHQRLLVEAWAIARREGLGAVSLCELARRIGLRQPSLYTYFDSKLDLYDAMFAQGNDQLWEEVATRSSAGTCELSPCTCSAPPRPRRRLARCSTSSASVFP